MAQGRFNWFDVTLTVVSLITLLFDVGTDIIMTVQFYLDGDTIWGSLMLAFTIIPLVVMNTFSLKWHSADGSLTCPTVLLHVFLLAPIQRYFRVLWLGFKSCFTGHPRFTDAALREQNDASILRLFETFLESAPQLILQLYIMQLRPDYINWIQGLSAGSSLVSLAWALTAYCDTLRLNYQTAYQRRFLALCLHCLWQLFMASARVTSLVLFASLFHAWVCLFAGIHWLIMTIWIWIKGTDFGHGKVEKGLFRFVSGFIYIFVYLNVHDGPTRSRMTFYYCLLFLEDAVLFAVWIIYGKPPLSMKIGAAVLVFGGFLLGGLCLMVYYRWLHPSGPNYLFSVKSTITTSQHQQLQSPKERRRQQAANNRADSPSVLNGSTLELSIESESPAKESAKGGNTTVKGGNATLSHLLDSSTRGALESAWQSGMQSSDSSSTSSLDADDCSLDAFNTTAKSTFSTVAGKSNSLRNTSQSQLSSVTIHSHHSDTASQPQPAADRSLSHHSTSNSQHPSRSDQPQSPSSRSQRSDQSEAASVRERASEPEQELLEGALREEADGTEASTDPHLQNGRPRSRISDLRSSLSPSYFGPVSSSSMHQHNQTTPSSRAEEGLGAVAAQPEPVRDHHQSVESRNDPKMLSPLDISKLSREPQGRISSPSASNILPAGRRAGRFDRLSHSFDLGESPILSPERAGQTPSNSRAMSENTSFVRREREAMAPYPDLVESMSPEPQQQRLYMDSEYGERAGGESMWGVSPNTSTSSSSRGRDMALSLPGSASRPSRLVDSFDSETEPACLNTMSLHRAGNDSQIQHQVENHRLRMLKQSLASRSPPSSNESPGVNNDGNETSWSSMNVNEDEWSGLNNLKALTPDDSLCSFASDEALRNTPGESQQAEKSVPIASRASTPSLPRSKSTSSLYHEFSSAGVSPSPPPGLRAARLSQNNSWSDSPEASQSRQQHPDTPWRLDYLNLDPAPPVEHDIHFRRHDPREIVIELLMDQLKRTSLRSNHSRSESARLSPLRMSQLRESPQHFGRNVDLFDRRAWRRLFGEDPDATLIPDSHIQSRGQYRTDIDLMREALDLIEMQRSPYSFRQGTSGRESPEVYVSGQYRPPIVDRGNEQTARSGLPAPRKVQDRHQSRARLDTSLRQASVHSTSLPRQTPGLGLERSIPHYVPQVVGDSRPRSMPAGQREGLYRYFVDSDSPIHTPHWNSPQNFPAAPTPSRHHLLHRYLAHNHVEPGLEDSPVQSAETHLLRKPSLLSGDCERPSSVLSLSQIRASRKSAAQQFSERLEVATDNPDSGMHSDSVSATSRRQPLQSLDNSPSLSPSSVTQQSIQAKPTPQQAAALKASAEQRHVPSSTRATHSSGHPSQTSSQSHSHGSPKRSSIRPRPHGVQGHRQAAGRSVDRRSASEASASQGPLSSRAKSADCLR